jgi:hypothetical protein
MPRRSGQGNRRGRKNQAVYRSTIPDIYFASKPLFPNKRGKKTPYAEVIRQHFGRVFGIKSDCGTCCRMRNETYIDLCNKIGRAKFFATNHPSYSVIEDYQLGHTKL